MRPGSEAKALRRARALLRQAERDQRSHEEQLLILDGRPGESKRERKRLLSLLGRELS
jgi:hypothetical protein